MKKMIKQLVAASYVDGELNQERVQRIINVLSRKELKAYITGIRQEEKRTTIVVEVPGNTSPVDEAELSKLFGNKKVRTEVNPDLILGLRITDNDDVYNMNLKTSLERIEHYAAE